MPIEVKITVHERVDEPGYVVRVVAGERVSRFLVDTRPEADALSESFLGYIDAGLPLDALLPEEPQS